jgi:glycosyltransferase involved in cell wall biosynthesis
MKILHIVSSIDLSGGGPSKSVSDLALQQAIQGQQVTILTYTSANPYLKESPHTNLQLVFVIKTSFKKTLNDLLLCENFDILHSHSLWQMPVHNMALLARKNNIPYIITPRGTIEPWAINAKKWKKKLAMALYQRKDLADAACIHATAKMEEDNIRKLGFTNSIAVIPNGIDIMELPLLASKPIKEKKTILFLSRIHQKKGIELLIEAWQQLDQSQRENWQIEIAGNGEKGYVAALQKLINDKGLSKEIHIIGPLYGETKLAAYHRADLFVLPTYSENFGIVVAEALACGVPVITTKGTPWEELNTHNAGWWIEIGAQSLAESLEKAIRLTNKERQQMGLNGRKLIEKSYSIQSVASQTIELYAWVLGKREQPYFVDIK